MLLNKQKKGTGTQGDKGGGNMFLISVTVLGSVGPIRFIIKEEELVATVIDTALKSYAREGRIPVLGSDQDQFLLYCSNYGSDAMSSWEMIGANGGQRWTPQQQQRLTGDRSHGRGAGRHGSTSPSNLRISSH